MKGGVNYLLPLPYLGQLFKYVASLTGIKKPNVPEAKGIVEVDWINGAFLMFRKSATEKAGLLDEDFFMYAEEAEWCARLRKTVKLCIFGDLHVIHLQGETSNEVYGSSGKGYKNLFDKKGLQVMLSNLVRIRKQFGVGWFLFIISIYILEIPVFFIGWLLSVIFNRKKYLYTQVKNYTANILQIIKLTPKIIRNRPFFYKT
jgi:GT2 family glycosyltransferase